MNAVVIDLPQSLTIGKVARAASVGVETVRYYRERGLLPEPQSAGGAFRHYPLSTVDRIRFIKRAQELGFSLEHIAELLKLQNGRGRRSIRRIASDQLKIVQTKLADLTRIEAVLGHLLHECESTSVAAPCPIIAALANESAVSAKAEPKRRVAASLRRGRR